MGKNKKELDVNISDADYKSIADEWKKVDWDRIQRMRFMNADAEIPFEDSLTGKYE